MTDSRIVAVAGRKGGTGKTTLAVLLASSALRSGRTVCVLDLDPQGSLALALGAHARNGSGSAHILEIGAVRDDDLVPVQDGFRIIPGGPGLEELPESLPDLREMLAGVGVDVVVLDLPPGHPRLDRAAMRAADVVLAVSEPHRLAIAGARRILEEAAALPNQPRRALVLGRMDTRRALDRSAPELLVGAFSVPLFSVPQDSGLALAMNAGRLPGKTRAGTAVDEIMEWIDE